MKIKIRNVSEDIVEKIDNLASDKNISRSEFLNLYFEHIANQNELFEVFNKYEVLLKRLEKTLEKNTDIMNRIVENVI